MRVVAKTGREHIAVVYIAAASDGRMVEFVESVQPPLPREKKWVVIVSCSYGCPVGCSFCDAGMDYRGQLPQDEIMFQIDYVVRRRFPDRMVAVGKFKLQFARMGEPSFNHGVLDVLDQIPDLYDARGLMPCISTVAPQGTDRFFEQLLAIKRKHYTQRFQLQFSIHSTDQNWRDRLIPVKKWSFDKMAEYGEAFYESGGRKVALNIALAEGVPVEADILLRYFSPEVFIIKITPVNPTLQATRNKIVSDLSSWKAYEVTASLRAAGYEVIVAIGELEENYIGSNCGQYVTAIKRQQEYIAGGYSYDLEYL